MRPVNTPHTGSDRDPLEEFVATHRDRFDTEPPSPAIWDALEAQLPAVERRLRPRERAPRAGGNAVLRKLYPYMRQAIAACVLLAIGLWGGLMLGNQRESDAQPLAERVTELERFYERELNRRMSLVASYAPEPELRRELADLVQLEVNEDPNLADAPEPAQREVLEAMAREYRVKLDALEHVLHQVRKTGDQRSFYNQPGPGVQEHL